MSAPAVELRGITLRYADDETGPGTAVLDGVDLAVEEGDLVLLAGRTGVGKSTLLGTVAGLVPRFTGGELHGDVLLDGRSVAHLPPRERAHLVGYVGQDPAAGFVTDTVEEELAYGMEQLGVAPATMRRRVEETLDLLGIADLRARDLRTLSGGQQQRVAIGSVLTTHPRVLVLDEPTSALDPTAAEEVLATLTRLAHDLGLAVVLAEHRLERVVPHADVLCLLAGDGRLVSGPPATVLRTSPVAPPLVDLGRAVGWADDAAGLPLTVRDARRRARSLVLGPPPDGGATAPRPEPLLRARGLVVERGPGRRLPVLRDVDVSLRPGEVTALMGRNGSGKSTLLWTLQGSGRRTRGEVVLTTPGAAATPATTPVTTPPTDPARLDADARRRRVGLVPQTAADLLYLETVAEECAAADDGARGRAGTCRGLLDHLVPGVPDDRHPRDLSEGQRLALALAVVLTPAPPVLLLDEPTRGLDYPAKAALAGALRRLAAQGRAVLCATHDVEFVAQVADRALVLAEGEVVSAGPARAVVAESPSFAPQVTKVLGPPWLRVDEVVAALAPAGARPAPGPAAPSLGKRP